MCRDPLIDRRRNYVPTGLWEAPRGDGSFDPTENRSGLYSAKANGWNADTDEGVGVAVTGCSATGRAKVSQT